MSRILYFTLTLAILCILFRESNSLSLSPECTTASGSGLKKRLSIVQRMFVVQLCDTELGNLTWSKVHEDQEELKNVDLKVQIDCHEQSGTRNINHNIGNRGDGLFYLFIYDFLYPFNSFNSFNSFLFSNNRK